LGGLTLYDENGNVIIEIGHYFYLSRGRYVKKSSKTLEVN